MNLMYRHCYTHYRALGFSRRRAALLAWRAAQGTPTMDIHGLWPIVIIVGLSYAAGAGSAAFVLGLLAVWMRARRIPGPVARDMRDG